MPPSVRPALMALTVLALVGSACRLAGMAPSAPGSGQPSVEPAVSQSQPVSAVPAPSVSGSPVGIVDAAVLEQLRQALLGEPPYPDGWEEQVDELIAELTAAIDEMQLPDTTGLDATDAACALWRPLVGNTDWAIGAFLERQLFIAHAAKLSEVAPEAIANAAEEAFSVSAAAAAAQLSDNADPDVISRRPREAIETIGLWAVERCDLAIEAEEAPNTGPMTRSLSHVPGTASGWRTPRRSIGQDRATGTTPSTHTCWR